MLENIGVWSFLEIANVRALEFLEIGKHQEVQSFWKLNKQINKPWKLTGVPGCVRTVEWILTVLHIANACPDICRILNESCQPCTEHISNIMQPQSTPSNMFCLSEYLLLR